MDALDQLPAAHHHDLEWPSQSTGQTELTPSVSALGSLAGIGLISFPTQSTRNWDSIEPWPEGIGVPLHRWVAVHLQWWLPMASTYGAAADGDTSCPRENHWAMPGRWSPTTYTYPRLRSHHRAGNNGAQRWSYTLILALGGVAVLTGLSIYKPTQLSFLTALFGGYEMARSIHFFVTLSFVAFFIVHIFQVAMAGFGNFWSMISGYELEVDEPVGDPQAESESAHV